MQSLLNVAQFMLANMWRGALAVDICQAAWVLLSTIRGLWLISHLGPVVYSVSRWAHTAMPVVTTILSAVVLL